jgi:hypothetical protein
LPLFYLLLIDPFLFRTARFLLVPANSLFTRRSYGTLFNSLPFLPTKRPEGTTGG